MATKNNSREDRFLQVLGKSFYIVNVLIRQQPLGGDGGGVEGKRGRHIFCNTKAMCREFYGGGSEVELWWMNENYSKQPRKDGFGEMGHFNLGVWLRGWELVSKYIAFH